MKYVRILTAYWLCICYLCLFNISASAQCFNNYTLSPIGNVCGNSATMTLSGSQSGVNYQLQVNGSNYGTPVYGTGSSINLGTVTSSTSGGGGTFLVVASSTTGSCSPTVVAGAGVEFVPVPGGTVTASNTLICSNGPVVFTVNPTLPAAYVYQWFSNGTSIPGANSQTYTATIAATYTVQISNSCGTAMLPCPAISTSPTVGSPGMVTGTTSRIAGAPGNSTYSVGAATNANVYLWSVSPTLAGTFSGAGTTVLFNWNPNFSGTAIISVSASDGCGPPSQASFLNVSVDLPSSASYSYIKETDIRVPNITSASVLTVIPIGQKSVTFTYEDQGGRTIQKVMESYTPGLNDVVKPMAYDPAGRQISTYLPYTVPGTNNGSYVTNPLTSQAAYYNPSTPGAPNIATSTNSTSQSSLDNSPLERVIEQGYPGSAWIQGGGHTVTTSYGTNISSEIYFWSINTNANGAFISSFYSPGSLLTTTVKDENGNSVTQYTDFSGKMACKKVQSGPTTYLYTYYVYDDGGNLRYVIPPLPTVPVTVTMPSSFVETDAVFNNFFYGYHYDGRNRLTEKKIPGKGWEYYVYNKLDQVVLSQTPTQSSLGVWTYTKYDANGRTVLTGDYNTTAVRSTLQSTADRFPSTLLFESFNNASSNFGYTDVSYPDNTVSNVKKVLSVSYYDNYNFLSNSSINPNTSIFTAPSQDTIYNSPEGLLTGNITNVLGAVSLTYLLSINHYDTYGRSVKTIGQSFKSGSASPGNYDIVQNKYSFDNLLLKSTRFHYLSSALVLTINSYYSYDQAGRKILLQQQYNNGPLVNLAEYDYNELGQLYKKSLQAPGQPAGTATDITLNNAITVDGTVISATNSITLGPGFSVAPGVSFQSNIVKPYMQTITNSYNMRGWLTKINDPNNFGTNTLFAEEIDYEQPNSSFSGTIPQYNGNISTTSWQTLTYPNASMIQELKGYVYNYDNLNRLTAAYSKAPSGNDKYNEVLTYDELGNILSLNRNATASTYLNELTYNYGSGSQRGNLLLSVQDNGGADNYNSTFSYQSLSGSETANSKTGVQQITYNELNLPSLINFSSGKTINFAYSSTGEELERVILQGNTINEDRSYIHGIEYVGSAINFIHTEEGRARPISNGYLLEYQVADHLGNVRAIFGDEAGNSTFLATSDIVQTTDYYPFGRQISYLDANPQFQYKFNAKEYSSDLNEYNYGARYYNPITARWNAIDNDAEKNRRLSPNVYTNNNPIRYIDPDGNDWVRDWATNQYQWMPNVTGYANTPLGYKYVGSIDQSIVTDWGWDASYKPLVSKSIGYINTDHDYNDKTSVEYSAYHLASVTSTSSISVAPNVAYTIDPATGASSRQFLGFNISVGTTSTPSQDDLATGGSVSMSYNGNTYSSTLTDPEAGAQDRLTAPGINYVYGNINIPVSQLVPGAAFPGANVFLQWQSSEVTGAGPSMLILSPLIPVPLTWYQQFNSYDVTNFLNLAQPADGKLNLPELNIPPSN